MKKIRYFLFFLLIFVLILTFIPNFLIADQRSDVSAFVTRFYEQCLSRGPDPGGLAGWTDQLLTGQKSGSDVAYGFVFSPEFVNKNVSNDEFVTIMYRSFFDRQPDPTGYNGWLGALNSGRSRQFVLEGFLGSQEFFNLCARYGIDPGTASQTATADSTDQTGILRVHFINVGQGDSIFIQLPSGGNILIDGGDRSGGDRVVSYLRGLGVSRINIVIGTHPHADHVSGLITVLNNFRVDNIMDSGVAHTTGTYQRYLDTIRSKNINYIVPEVGNRFDLQHGTFLDIMGPVTRSESDLNNSSIVAKLTHGNMSFLFTGDAQKEQENQMLQYGLNLLADVLKVGHHGSYSSTNINFLRAVRPAIAVISCGAGNRYGHPHAIVLNNLASLGVGVYRTDVSGDIIIESDGRNVRVVKG